jgi:hypothetical protein
MPVRIRDSEFVYLGRKSAFHRFSTDLITSKGQTRCSQQGDYTGYDENTVLKPFKYRIIILCFFGWRIMIVN